MRGYLASQFFSFLFFSQLLSSGHRRYLMFSFPFFSFFCRYRRGSGCDEYRVDLRHSRLPLPPRGGVPPISRCKHSRCIRTHTSCMHVCSDVFVCPCLSFLCGCKSVLTIEPPLHNIPYKQLWILDFPCFHLIHLNSNVFVFWICSGAFSAKNGATRTRSHRSDGLPRENVGIVHSYIIVLFFALVARPRHIPAPLEFV
jgi:hypothetical protein